MDEDDLYARAEAIIHLHEKADFDSLSEYIDEVTRAKEGSWFSQKRYDEVCEELAKELGRSRSISHIDSLHRKTTLLTLWKVMYSDNDDEVLWQIAFDRKTFKVKMLSIMWDHPV